MRFLHSCLEVPAIGALFCALLGAPLGCSSPATSTGADSEPKPLKEPEPTIADAEKFMEEVEKQLLQLWINHERAEWVKATYITDDTTILAAQTGEATMEFVARKVGESKRFQNLKLEGQLARKFNLLRTALSMPAPSDPSKRTELAKIGSQMKSDYGKGAYCPDGPENQCHSLGSLNETFAKSRDFDELQKAWVGWRSVFSKKGKTYARFVELANEGARELGFQDLGSLWKSRYDMAPDEFDGELERLWLQVKPLYEQLHCYVRSKLGEQYGEDKVAQDGPIPAHLLGNMWGQEWNNIFDLVAPLEQGKFDPGAALVKKNFDPRGIVRQAEAFFVSLGLAPLPDTFWQRSMFEKPRDREVVCHPSAWDIDWKDDLRIKMCIKINLEDFTTVHHELGHSYYQRAYKDQSPLFADSANDGFHEALGDTIALSVTPAYFQKIDLIDEEPTDSLLPLLSRALEKVAFLPFGLVVDKWRSDVFSGKVTPAEYNSHWWKLRTQYQGIEPPVERSRDDFDPGAKYHVMSNVPYTRYFLAAILQFQFHRALCKISGHDGPLHQCSIYGNRVAGARLGKMMEMGASAPWREALKVLTDENQMDASAILEYFETLLAWLKNENKEAACGWK